MRCPDPGMRGSRIGEGPRSPRIRPREVHYDLLRTPTDDATLDLPIVKSRHSIDPIRCWLELCLVRQEPWKKPAEARIGLVEVEVGLKLLVQDAGCNLRGVGWIVWVNESCCSRISSDCVGVNHDLECLPGPQLVRYCGLVDVTYLFAGSTELV